MFDYRSWRIFWSRLQQNAVRLTSGGSWSSQLPENTQRNLRWFFFDGLFASASDAINLNYLTLFVLALGASRAQIGIMSALASLSATLLLIPGAMLAERSRSRKQVVLMSGGGITRLMLLALALIPLVVKGSAVVYVAIALKIIADGFANMSLPAWTSMTGDVVPLRWRGRYFGSRNVAMGVANMVATLLVGTMITAIGGAQGYQVAFGLAFAIGLLSTFSFSRLEEPPAVVSEVKPGYSFASLFQTLRAGPNFLRFCLYSALWNFSLAVAGPFFNVYLVQDLNATAAMVGVVAISSSLAGLPAQRIFGQLADRWGPRKVLLLTGSFIPLLPLSWLLARAAWHPILINVFGGVLWAGYGLASFNFLLSITPESQRARYSAIAQIAVAISTALGSALGGLMATAWGIPVVFAISGIGRFFASGIFARYVHAPEGEARAKLPAQAE
jgi:MFS family permease